MADAMVTGRMPVQKKKQGNAILRSAGLTASQAINMLYERLINEQSVRFLTGEQAQPSAEDFAAALDFVDKLVVPLRTRFDDMTDAEIMTDRLRARGLFDA